MIEISFAKLILLALVALVVLGPEKLPGAARTAGALLRRVRNGWDSVRSEVERELEVEEIRRAAHEAMTRAEAAQAEFRAATTDVEQAVGAVRDEVQAAVAPPPAAGTVDPTTAQALLAASPDIAIAPPEATGTAATPVSSATSPVRATLENADAALARAWPASPAAVRVGSDALAAPIDGTEANTADADVPAASEEPDPQQELPLAMPTAVSEVRHGRH